jgi:hypothetical protein
MTVLLSPDDCSSLYCKQIFGPTFSILRSVVTVRIKPRTYLVLGYCFSENYPCMQGNGHEGIWKVWKPSTGSYEREEGKTPKPSRVQYSA